MAEAGSEVRISWADRGCWTPIIHHSRAATSEELLTILEAKVCGPATISPAWNIGKDLTLTCAEFGDHMRSIALAANSTQRENADFLAAFGCDVYGTGPKKETMADTEFRTMSGAGHQHFLGFMKELAIGTDAAHLRRTLFEAWKYDDGRPSLRWDPADYRPHALRAVDPSGDPIKTMRGANRLAVEAIPLFPTVPKDRRVRTVAFDNRASGTEIAWPIWIDRLELRTVASLLASDSAHDAGGKDLVRPGIAQVFRARRFTEGKYRNFSPAKAVL